MKNDYYNLYLLYHNSKSYFFELNIAIYNIIQMSTVNYITPHIINYIG